MSAVQQVRFMAGMASSSFSVSFVTSVTSSTSSIDISGSGRQANDIAVYFDYARMGAGAPIAVTPTGFTNVTNATNGVNRGMVSYKKLDGTEGSLTGMNGDSTNSKAVLIFRPSANPSSLVTGSVNQECTGGDPVSQSVTCAAVAAPLIVLALNAAAPAPTTDSFSPAADATVTSNLLKAKYKIYNSSPQNTTVDQGDDGNGNTVESFYLQVVQ